ncbi:MAG: acetoacetate decarboxylase family protein [Archaeoglobaceae archaeon]|nr:acetoacetate decarboxylase family protein [Archaeoglobaceae archaeon]
MYMLKGSREGVSIPLDASLYGAPLRINPRDTVAEYINCEAVMAFFTTSDEVDALLPEGLNLSSNPPHAAVFITNYPYSTLGPYYEMFSLIQIEHKGSIGYYIPYIYVTNDAALASGREVVGAPKKLAHIGIVKENDIILGYLERPKGKRLLSLTVKPEQRIPEDLVNTFLQRRVECYSLRLLPPIEGGDGVAQLVKWISYIDIHEDGEERVTYDHVKLGRKRIWSGDATITYDSPSISDPVHKIPVKDLLLGAYINFDMALRPEKVVKEWKL